MKKYILSLIALIGAANFAMASTVALSSAATGPSVFLTNGSALVPNGSLIRVGTLLIAGDATSFVEFGTSTVKNAGVGASAKPSKVAGSVTNATEADDTAFNGAAIYVWIYNSTTPVAFGDTSVAQGLYRSNVAVFPTNDINGVGDAATAFATDFLTSVELPYAGWTQATFSAQGDNGTGNATGGRFVLGSAIPEAGSSTLGMLALGLLISRRKR